MNTDHKKLYRSSNRMIAGVLAGIAEYFDIDPTVVRLAYAFIAIFSALVPATIVYIAAWIIVPEHAETHAPGAHTHTHDAHVSHETHHTSKEGDTDKESAE